MPSQKQIDANRRNAQKSTGPRTTEGRAAVRCNAFKHGLTAENLLLDLDCEEKDAFNELFGAFAAEYEPQTATEHTLVEQLVSAAWRLRRARLIEQGIFDDRIVQTSVQVEDTHEDPADALRLGYVFRQDVCGPDALNTLSRYEARIERSYYKALRELQRLRDLRPKPDLQKQTQSAATPVESIAPSMREPPEAQPRDIGGGCANRENRENAAPTRLTPIRI